MLCSRKRGCPGCGCTRRRSCGAATQVRTVRSCCVYSPFTSPESFQYIPARYTPRTAQMQTIISPSFFSRHSFFSPTSNSIDRFSAFLARRSFCTGDMSVVPADRCFPLCRLFLAGISGLLRGFSPTNHIKYFPL